MYFPTQEHIFYSNSRFEQEWQCSFVRARSKNVHEFSLNPKIFEKYCSISTISLFSIFRWTIFSKTVRSFNGNTSSILVAIKMATTPIICNLDTGSLCFSAAKKRSRSWTHEKYVLGRNLQDEATSMTQSSILALNFASMSWLARKLPCGCKCSSALETEMSVSMSLLPQ